MSTPVSLGVTKAQRAKRAAKLWIVKPCHRRRASRCIISLSISSELIQLCLIFFSNWLILFWTPLLIICRPASWWDQWFADQIFRLLSIERHAAAKPTQRPRIYLRRGLTFAALGAVRHGLDVPLANGEQIWPNVFVLVYCKVHTWRMHTFACIWPNTFAKCIRGLINHRTSCFFFVFFDSMYCAPI